MVCLYIPQREITTLAGPPSPKDSTPNVKHENTGRVSTASPTWPGDLGSDVGRPKLSLFNTEVSGEVGILLASEIIMQSGHCDSPCANS